MTGLEFLLLSKVIAISSLILVVGDQVPQVGAKPDRFEVACPALYHGNIKIGHPCPYSNNGLVTSLVASYDTEFGPPRLGHYHKHDTLKPSWNDQEFISYYKRLMPSKSVKKKPKLRGTKYKLPNAKVLLFPISKGHKSKNQRDWRVDSRINGQPNRRNHIRSGL